MDDRLAGIAIAVVVGLSLTGMQAQEAGPPARDLTKTLEHGGVQRTYHIHLPPGFSQEKGAALVLALHGGGGQGKRFNQSTNGTICAAADERGIVVVFPDGMNRQWNDGRTEHLKGWGEEKKAYDDVGFISALIDRMVAEYGIDPQRVFATGISNGGFMSIRLAIDLSHKIAAVAPVTAQLSKALEGQCPKLPISVMIINGTKDPLVPFDGGDIRVFKMGRSRGKILSTEATIDHFRRHNGCKETPIESELPDRDPDDGTRVTVAKYEGGKEGTEVILVKVVGGGHTWPGGQQYLPPALIGVVCRDFDASEMILDFFSRHARKK